jgi:hypothetical protein
MAEPENVLQRKSDNAIQIPQKLPIHFALYLPPY